MDRKSLIDVRLRHCSMHLQVLSFDRNITSALRMLLIIRQRHLYIYKQVGAVARRHATLTGSYRLSQNAAFPLMKCIRQYVHNGPLIILVFVWRKSINFWRRFVRKMIVTFSFPVTFIPQFCFTIVGPVQRYVSIKLEVCTALLFRENRRHGADRQTDERSATLNVAPREGRIIILAALMSTLSWSLWSIS